VDSNLKRDGDSSSAQRGLEPDVIPS